MSLSRCSCCEVRSSSSWTSSSPTPRGANLCPSYFFSSHMDLCLGPLSLDGQGQAAGELSQNSPSGRTKFSTSIYPSIGSPWSLILAKLSLQLFSIMKKTPVTKYDFSILEWPDKVFKTVWYKKKLKGHDCVLIALL